MLVELGNPAPTTTDNTPCVLRIHIPDEYSYVVADSGVETEVAVGRTATLESAADLAVELMRQVSIGDPALTHIPDHEAALAVINAVRAESTGVPTWVWSDNEPLAVLLGHYFGCPVGRPDDVEDTHFTFSGPPGVGPDDAPIVDAADPEEGTAP